MALQVNLPAAKTRVGIAAPTAYARIDNLEFNTRSGRIDLQVGFYYDAAARAAGKSTISNLRLSGIVGQDGLPDLDTTIAGVRSVLYTWLKTKPEFAGATDV